MKPGAEPVSSENAAGSADDHEAPPASMKAPWASESNQKTPEELKQELQEKLARAKAMKPGAEPMSPASPVKVARSPRQTPLTPPRSPGLVTAPWAQLAEEDAPPPLCLSSPKSAMKLTVLTATGVTKTYDLRTPTKAIRVPDDLTRFQQGEAFRIVKEFILSLNDSCVGKRLQDVGPISPECQAVVDVLKLMGKWVDEIPPIAQPMRYGNRAFKDWIERIVKDTPALIEKILPEHIRPAAIELAPYFINSFGDKTRIDYGTGHEHCFACFLAALATIGFFKESDSDALALVVFWEYLQLVRKLQSTYKLEPAGSHGCWSLDDYQFIPFMWGSAQLIDHPTLSPSSIHDDRAVQQHAASNYYMHCIHFIKKVKSGHISENSPMLNDISAVQSWKRCNNGMIKMFFAEVMDKFPVMQHMLFGSILPPP
mmetsp:Transcript_54561/g.129106  ORF Transcript_54561/g.129106 Transcript_54561/m.129106 type:complete len:427 (+) Transcript_54561:3-1283(+)